MKALVCIGALLLCVALSAEPLGFFEQKFTSINFDKGKWSRTEQLPCYTYSAKENGATVEVLGSAPATSSHSERHAVSTWLYAGPRLPSMRVLKLSGRSSPQLRIKKRNPIACLMRPMA